MKLKDYERLLMRVNLESLNVEELHKCFTSLKHEKFPRTAEMG